MVAVLVVTIQARQATGVVQAALATAVVRAVVVLVVADQARQATAVVQPVLATAAFRAVVVLVVAVQARQATAVVRARQAMVVDLVAAAVQAHLALDRRPVQVQRPARRL